MEDEDFDISISLDHQSVNDWDFNVSIPSGISISFGPIEMNKKPPQPDLFRHYICSQWTHSSHIADEDPQWQCESWIQSRPYLCEAKDQNRLEVADGSSEDDYDYFYRGTAQEFLIFKLRWSEYFDDIPTQ